MNTKLYIYSLFFFISSGYLHSAERTFFRSPRPPLSSQAKILQARIQEANMAIALHWAEKGKSDPAGHEALLKQRNEVTQKPLPETPESCQAELEELSQLFLHAQLAWNDTFKPVRLSEIERGTLSEAEELRRFQNCLASHEKERQKIIVWHPTKVRYITGFACNTFEDKVVQLQTLYESTTTLNLGVQQRSKALRSGDAQREI